ncbi:MAG: hypothetical protein UHS47_01405, partial [Oscillospiraceae bacterium]|nr:hypothetical protein [Oscillospiraceae bacterium]
IHKEIEPSETVIRTQVGFCIRIDESADLGIVITGLEIIVTGLCSGILATMENRAVFKGVFYSQKLPVMIAISV